MPGCERRIQVRYVPVPCSLPPIPVLEDEPDDPCLDDAEVEALIRWMDAIRRWAVDARLKCGAPAVVPPSLGGVRVGSGVSLAPDAGPLP